MFTVDGAGRPEVPRPQEKLAAFSVPVVAGFGNLARTTLSEFPLADDHFRRPGGESHAARQPRSQPSRWRCRPARSS
ncbi:hypothetical protein [Amycolatopsis sp. NPDC051372]|uniref:hypothetical protein n=1 Tax=Amycolatopsis sp. NPDC051372 TaxID=3155669 RepID=UPI003425241A